MSIKFNHELAKFLLNSNPVSLFFDDFYPLKSTVVLKTKLACPTPDKYSSEQHTSKFECKTEVK